MIDEIEVAFAERAASEERLRRFLADASHELRTPLTSILGYAELFDLGVRDRPDDLAASMRHIKDEATRMGTLVEDLFLLAQLDQRASAATSSRWTWPSWWSVRWPASGCRRPTVGGRGRRPLPCPSRGRGPHAPGRRQPARQRRHTRPAGPPSESRVAEEGEWAVLTVHDDGPGIDPADADPDLRTLLPGRSVPGPLVRGGRAGTGHRDGHRRRPITGTVTVRAGDRGHLRGAGPGAAGRRWTGRPSLAPDEVNRRRRSGRLGGRVRRDSGRDVADRSLDDLARADAGRAGVEPPGRSVHQGPDPLDVRVPTTLGPPVGVADVHAERRLLPAHLTHRCHDVPTSSRSSG